MKNSKEESRRWLRQAQYDLEEAKASLKRESFSYTCFFAEQAAQKAIKGFLISRGERFVPLHSIGDLLEKAAEFENIFNGHVESGRILDRYYLITRYPDALPSPAVPYEVYSEAEAKEAVAIAEGINVLCRQHSGDNKQDNTPE
jgi:HEPN domain-containing protein